MRYRSKMDVKDILVENLRYAAFKFGGTAQLAEATQRVVDAGEAEKAGCAKYFDQVIAGYQGKADKSPRSVGKQVAAAVSLAIGEDIGWMYVPHEDLWRQAHADEQEDRASTPARSRLKARDDYVTFDLYDVRMSAGPGVEPVDQPDVIDQLRVLRSWALDKIGSANPDNIKLATCNGTSMSPTIEDGALMFIDISVRDFRGDSIYCLAWHDKLIVKRLIADVVNKTLRIVSDNDDKTIYPDQELSGSQLGELQILAQVVRWIDVRKP